MQRISTGTHAVPGIPGMCVTITFDPMADATPADFVRQLNGASALRGFLIGTEIKGAHVIVTLTDFKVTKEALQRSRQLPRFTYLLPNE